MTIFRNSLRAIVVTLLLVLVGVPTAVYVLLSMPQVQNVVREQARDALSELLGSEVEIGKVAIHPFNRLTISDVRIADDTGATALQAARVSGAFELRHFLLTRQIIVDYVVVDGMMVKLWRQTDGSPLNIQGIINRLKKPDSGSKSRLKLRVNTLSVLNSGMSYDVLSAPAAAEGRFCPGHILLQHFRLQARIGDIGDDCYNVEIKHLECSERSGLRVDNFTTSILFTPDKLQFGGAELRLPHSRLALAPLQVHDSLDEALSNGSINISIEEPSMIYPPDLKAIVPWLECFDVELNIAMSSQISLTDAHCRLSVSDADGPSSLSLSAAVTGNAFNQNINALDFYLESLDAVLTPQAAAMARHSGLLAESSPLWHLLSDGMTRLYARGSVLQGRGQADVVVDTGLGHVDLSGQFTLPAEKGRPMPAKVTVDVSDLMLAELLNNQKVPSVIDANIDLSGTIGTAMNLTTHGEISRLRYNDHDFNDIDFDIDWNSSGQTRARVQCDDVDARLSLQFEGILAKNKPLNLSAMMELDSISLDALGVQGKHPGSRVWAAMEADVAGQNIDDLKAGISASNFLWTDTLGRRLSIPTLELSVQPDGPLPYIELESSIADAMLTGSYKLSTLVPTLRTMFGRVMPTFAYDPSGSVAGNEFDLSATLHPCRQAAEFFGIGMWPVADMTIEGVCSERRGLLSISADAPYIRKGDIIVEGTSVHATIDRGEATVFATTQMPTKKGLMVPVVHLKAANDRADTHINWAMERQRPLKGEIDFSTLVRRTPSGAVETIIDMNPGEITFGEDLWRIEASQIEIGPYGYVVNDFTMNTDTQSIKARGRISHDPADILTLDLANINLIEIFETLEIDNVLISGRATGSCVASDLLSPSPMLRTEGAGLHVRDIGYNYCTIGDADVQAAFNPDDLSIALSAVIDQPEGKRSHISGSIWPAQESLDFTFLADDVPVGFMEHYLGAFANNITGRASGRAHLFGTFKYIDLEGEVLAKDLSLEVDFTRVTYTTTDSVKMVPGKIIVPGATLHDPQGNTARIAGTVWHRFFAEPRFDFQVTDARNLLCYNTTAADNPDWYGTIYGNGAASVTGEPGVVNIGANMATAPGSTFTFVLNDRVDAEELSFITFRDRTVVQITDSLVQVDDTPQDVIDYRARAYRSNAEESSAYNIKMQIDITPDASMCLVMDPVGKDAITATGKGNLQMTYGSVDNQLWMYGTYVLDKGKYNFTLQDIIRKDFTIRPGSSITFVGDPYSAALDINAIYSVNANLSDLDKSFLSDPELNRTNVNVNAVLNVTGDMRQPDIAFDLEFPLLKQDTYRKVRSIISTEEMMNRQIIYLLALNRFYTPDYMSTTKGSELFSVASSTISGQLSNMLGKLSENWSIAPNLRSDRGDFSDLEVDVMLSSRLLNNRLLFNGNFGYREKSLNTNQFIGDFDIEYLLTKSGNWRLKAYNRYNDQSYYLRTAKTTQGVGIVFKHDFDGFFGGLFKNKPAQDIPAQANSKSEVPEAAEPDGAEAQERSELN